MKSFVQRFRNGISSLVFVASLGTSSGCAYYNLKSINRTEDVGHVVLREFFTEEAYAQLKDVYVFGPTTITDQHGNILIADVRPTRERRIVYSDAASQTAGGIKGVLISEYLKLDGLVAIPKNIERYFIELDASCAEINSTEKLRLCYLLNRFRVDEPIDEETFFFDVYPYVGQNIALGADVPEYVHRFYRHVLKRSQHLEEEWEQKETLREMKADEVIIRKIENKK